MVGRFAFSAKGSPFYIAVVTLALTTAATTLYSQFPTVTGGENGLFGFNPLTITTRAWYYLTLAALVLVTAGALILVRSDVGLLLRAVRDNEVRTRYLGYSVENVKTVTFMGGAGLAAFAGGLMALATGLVAADLFTFLFATQMMVWVAVGGRATIIGPVIGAIGLQLLGARLSGSFPTQWSLIQGLLFVLVVVFTPSGILPPLTRAFGRLLRRDARADEREIVPETTAPPPLPDKSPVISVSGLEFGYGSLQVLRGVDLKVQRGELLCVVGPNGGRQVDAGVRARRWQPVRQGHRALRPRRTHCGPPSPGPPPRAPGSEPQVPVAAAVRKPFGGRDGPARPQGRQTAFLLATESTHPHLSSGARRS